MRAEDRVRLRYMIEAAERARQFIAGCQRQDLDEDHMLRFALERESGKRRAGGAYSTTWRSDLWR
jgi:hypothetical protein